MRVRDAACAFQAMIPTRQLSGSWPPGFATNGKGESCRTPDLLRARLRIRSRELRGQLSLCRAEAERPVALRHQARRKEGAQEARGCRQTRSLFLRCRQGEPRAG